MDVWEFEKCLATHLEECGNVLQCTGQSVPASQVRSEWAYHIELKIEPTGWNSLWKIPRILCEEYCIRYPTVVYGTVQQVLFKELKAIFTVDYVQDDDIHLPESYTVQLEDLWPTKQQENTALDIEGTANCLDSLRFFYKNIWMPWDADNDDDLDWPDRHLESRIKFYYDMKKEIKRPIVAHIKRLLSEARYLQTQKEYLEMEFSDEEDLNDTSNKGQITRLMKLHLRMTMIKSEIDLLENPETRVAFDEMNEMTAYNKSFKQNDVEYKECTFIVSKFVCLDDQLKYLEKIRQIIGGQKTIHLCLNLQDCLEMCEQSNGIYISEGKHSIKFLEYLNDCGSICGANPLDNSMDNRQNNDICLSTESVIKSSDEDSLLLMFHSDFVIENVTLDCRNVRTGILIRKGNVKLINCTIVGDFQSSTSVGITLMGNSKLHLKNCLIKNFATGIHCHDSGTVLLEDSMIYNCYIGMETNDSLSMTFENTKIQNCKRYGISMISKTYPTEEKKLIFEQFSDLKWEHSLWGACLFDTNTKGNIIVYNNSKLILNDSLQCSEIDDCLLEDTVDISDSNYSDCDGNCKHEESIDLSKSSVYDDSLMHITIDDTIMDNSVIEVE